MSFLTIILSTFSKSNKRSKLKTNIFCLRISKAKFIEFLKYLTKDIELTKEITLCKIFRNKNSYV